ncbi:MAG TPA: DUF4157 domain-containing protein [Thermoanaerobaculia bacterium]|nr:DUF4157 domain-containing protein [Thermoanaerobaculia bacterium]
MKTAGGKAAAHNVEGVAGPPSPWSVSGIPILQRKLRVGAVDDPMEQEADHIAERVMRAPLGATIQRDIGKDEIQEQLIRSLMGENELLQRQALTPEDLREQERGEEILMQAKAAGPGGAREAGTLEDDVHALEGRGDPLPDSVRAAVEPRFGHAFGNVRVHADAHAADLARTANARAFTVGRNVVFGAGEYAPTTSEGGRLLAHELTHVVQQGRAGPAVQRKIVVGGLDYTPTTKYQAWLTANFGAAMKEFVVTMHNGGSPPEYKFTSFEQLGFEIRTRAAAIQGLEEIHKTCCEYFSTADPPYLDSTYWDQIGSGVNFVVKSSLPAGKGASDAIEAVFAPGAKTRVECMAMTQAVQYRSMLKAIGKAKFNAMFPGGAGIRLIMSGTYPLIAGASRTHDVVAVGSKSEILPGDWVYFKNFSDYSTRVPGGYWQGENAVYLGGGMYRGFGVAALSETDLNKELVKKYNTEGVPVLSKTVADLLAEGGGLLLNPVVRPIMSKIAP